MTYRVVDMHNYPTIFATGPSRLEKINDSTVAIVLHEDRLDDDGQMIRVVVGRIIRPIKDITIYSGALIAVMQRDGIVPSIFADPEAKAVQ